MLFDDQAVFMQVSPSFLESRLVSTYGISLVIRCFNDISRRCLGCDAETRYPAKS